MMLGEVQKRLDDADEFFPMWDLMYLVPNFYNEVLLTILERGKA
jgi:hypothetical protein